MMLFQLYLVGRKKREKEEDKKTKTKVYEAIRFFFIRGREKKFRQKQNEIYLFFDAKHCHLIFLFECLEILDSP
jgi:hypothetical protein